MIYRLCRTLVGGSVDMSPSDSSTVSCTAQPSLRVIDNRTGKEYEIPITNGHFIDASAFSQIKGPADHEDDGEMCASHVCESEGLMIFDPSFSNTAVTTSSICYVDGDRGVLLYRGYPIEDLIEKSTFLEVAYLLIYGHLPSKVMIKYIIQLYLIVIGPV